jgi:hypothetical protein
MEKITLSLTSKKEKHSLFTYDVITSPEKEQRSANQYSHTHTHTHTNVYILAVRAMRHARARAHTHTHNTADNSNFAGLNDGLDYFARICSSPAIRTILHH